MKREFKNLIGQVDFKILYENKEIKNKILFENDFINESMDFSNRTGFSESLVGRAINKFFSFGKTQIMYKYLDTYKTDIEDVYLRAVLSAFNTMNIRVEKTQEKTQEQGQEQGQEEGQEEGQEGQKAIDKFLVDALAISLTNDANKDKMKKKFIELGMVEQDVTTIVKYVSEIQEIQKSQKDENTNKSEIDKVLSELNYTNKEKIITIEKYKESNNPSEKISNQITFYQNVLNNIKGIELNKQDTGMLIKISTNIDTEINKITDDSNKEELKKIKKNINDITNGKDYDEISDEDFKKTNIDDEIQQEYIKQILHQLFTHYNTIIKEELNKEENVNNKSIYKKIQKMIHPDIASQIKTKDQLISHILEFKKLLEKVGINENLRNLYDDLSMIYEDVKNNTSLVKVKSVTDNRFYDDEAKKHITELKDKTMELIKLSDVYSKIDDKTKALKIDDIGTTKTDTDSVKQTLKDYSKISFTDIDPITQLENIKNDTEKLKKYHELAINNVNKELLKVIALKAEMLYNTENYKDTRNDVYSRVNFSTTEPDKKKLEMKWKKIISEVKSIYMPFFSDNGSFPSSLDPIALIESDKTFRTNFQEYNDISKEILDNNTNTKEKALDTPQLTKLKLTEKNMKKNTNYIFDVISTVGDESHVYSLFFQAVNKIDDNVSDSNTNLYLFKGMILLTELIKSENMETDKLEFLNEFKTKELIKEYTIIKIDDLDAFTKKSEWSIEKINRHKEIFDRYSKYSNDNKLLLYNSNDLTRSTKHFIKILLENDEFYAFDDKKDKKPIIGDEINENDTLDVITLKIKKVFHVKENEYWVKTDTKYDDLGKKMKVSYDKYKESLSKIWEKMKKK